MAVLLAVLLWVGQSPTQGAALHSDGGWIRVPFVRQTTDGCGSASLAMVMQYWEQTAPSLRGAVAAGASDPRRIQAQLFARRAHGIYASRMVEYLHEAGFATYAFHGEWADLVHQIAQGRPLIVAMRDGGRHGPLHYVVVVGADADHVYLNDPARQPLLRLDRSGFLSAWSATEDWTLLALPPPHSAAAGR